MVAKEFDCESLTVAEESVDSNEATGSDLREWAGDGEKTEPNTRLRPALRGTVESILFRGHRAYCEVVCLYCCCYDAGVDDEVNVWTRLSGLHPLDQIGLHI